MHGAPTTWEAARHPPWPHQRPQGGACPLRALAAATSEGALQQGPYPGAVDRWTSETCGGRHPRAGR